MNVTREVFLVGKPRGLSTGMHVSCFQVSGNAKHTGDLWVVMCRDKETTEKRSAVILGLKESVRRRNGCSTLWLTVTCDQGTASLEMGGDEGRETTPGHGAFSASAPRVTPYQMWPKVCWLSRETLYGDADQRT